jgi:hypothetical protein
MAQSWEARASPVVVLFVSSVAVEFFVEEPTGISGHVGQWVVLVPHPWPVVGMRSGNKVRLN